MARRPSSKASPQKTPRTSKERIAAKVSKAAGPKEAPKNARFWEHGEEAHLAVFADGERIARATRQRRMQDLYLACLYDDEELASLVSGYSAVSAYTPQTMSTNIVKRQVDAFVTKLAKNRPVPMGLTTGGNYGQQRRAKALSKFFEGVLDEVGFWETREQRLRDGALFGSGLAFNYRKGRKFVHDRVFPWELEVDPREAMYGKPKTLRFKRYVDKLELIERFPDFEEQIREAQSKAEEDRWSLGWDETCDLVLLRGAWRLPDNDAGKNGAFALCVSNATLELADYKRPYFPFSKFDVLPGLVGWRGQGIAKSLIGLQFEANSVGMRLQEQGYMTGSYVFVEGDSGVETDTIDNGCLTVVRYQGTQPQFHTPNPWHPQLFDWYQNLRGRFPAEETRISEMAVRGEKPPGLDSGKAIRAWNQIDDEAYLPAGRADERDVINTCWQLFDLAEEIYSEKGDEKDERKPYTVRVEDRKHGRSVLEELAYDKVRLDREQFTLRVFPTSFLTGTPAERMQTVKELTEAGFLSQDEAISLLDFPDLQRVMNLRGAARRNIERLLEKLRDADDPKAEYEYPEPAWNLDLCKALALMGYLEAKLDGVPEANLRQILQFAIDAQWKLDNPEGDIENQGVEQQQQAEDAAVLAQAEAEAAAAEGMMPGGPMPDAGAQYAPPQEPVMPANAVAPEAMPMLPGGV
jgi:hypothetical protein